MQAKWRRWMAECGIQCSDKVPVEIDPVYAVDAAELAKIGICLGAE